MVTAITSFAGIFRDMGLSSAAIQKKDLTSGQQSNLFWLNVAMGLALTLVVASCSPLVAWFFGKPELTSVTIALSFNFVIASFGSQHGAMLVRSMQFGRRAIASISSGLLSLCIAVVLAYSGFSYWALVASTLTGSFTNSLLLFLLSPFWPGLPGRGRGVRSMLAFGAHVTTFEVVNYFHRNLDNILIGKFSGVEALGLYSKAYALLMFPIHAIRAPINSVAFPALSRLQDQAVLLRKYYLRVCSIVAQLTMPVVAMLFVTSDEVIEILLGTRWLECSPLFSLLALTAFIQPVAGLRGMLMMATGSTRNYVFWGFLNAIVVSIGFLIAVPWGPEGIAISLAIANYTLLYPSLLLAFQNTIIEPVDLLFAIWQPVIASVLACFIAIAIRPYVYTENLFVVLGVLCITFTLTYLLTLSALPGGLHQLRHFKQLLWELVNKPRIQQ